MLHGRSDDLLYGDRLVDRDDGLLDHELGVRCCLVLAPVERGPPAADHRELEHARQSARERGRVELGEGPTAVARARRHAPGEVDAALLALH